MSDWRQEALVRLPLLRELIEEAATIGDLWRELELELREAYQSPDRDEALVVGIYAFASWCLNHCSDTETVTAVVGFYETLASRSSYLVREDMARRLSLDDFERLHEGGAFRYYLTTPEEQETFAREFLERKGVRRPATEKPLPKKAFKGISSRKR